MQGDNDLSNEAKCRVDRWLVLPLLGILGVCNDDALGSYFVLYLGVYVPASTL